MQRTHNNKVLPHSKDAEMCLVGSMVVAGTSNINIIDDVIETGLTQSDFFFINNGVIFNAIISLYTDNIAIDGVQLLQKLKDGNVLEDVGGSKYIIHLVESVPVAEHAVHYAKIVRKMSDLRKIITACCDIADMCYSDNAVSDIIERGESVFDSISNKKNNSMLSIGNSADLAITDIISRKNCGIDGLSTGYRLLDDRIDGLRNGEMVVLAARPSVGKSAMAVNIAQSIAESGVPVVFFSLEMTHYGIAERIIAAHAGVNIRYLRRNDLGDWERDKIKGDILSKLKKTPLYIDCSPNMSIVTMRSRIRRYMQQFGIKLAVIDYLQIMSVGKDANLYQKTTEISSAIKAAALEFNIPILALSQLNRGVEGRENKMPRMSDLRESGAIEQDADVIMMLHREDLYRKEYDHDRKAVLNIVKSRGGECGIIGFDWIPEYTKFQEERNYNGCDNTQFTEIRV